MAGCMGLSQAQQPWQSQQQLCCHNAVVSCLSLACIAHQRPPKLPVSSASYGMQWQLLSLLQAEYCCLQYFSPKGKQAFQSCRVSTACPMAFGLNMQALKSGQGIVLDLDFQDLMTEQEMRSLVGQLQFAYAANCKAEVPAHLYFTGFSVSAAVSSLPLGMHCSADVSIKPAGVGELVWQASAS